MKVVQVSKKIKSSAEGYRFVPLGAGVHYAPQKLLWIARNFPHDGDKIQFPVMGDVRETKGGNLLLYPGQKIIHLFYVPCGYRGETELIYSSIFTEGKIFYFPSFESERGSKGISIEVLVIVQPQEKIVLGFYRTGRLYGESANLTLSISGESWEVLPASPEEVIELG